MLQFQENHPGSCFEKFAFCHINVYIYTVFGPATLKYETNHSKKLLFFVFISPYYIYYS